MIEALQVSPDDNVTTLLVDGHAGGRIDGVELAGDTPRGHKIALRAIASGEPVIKFGFPIGRAVQPIEPGEHVHSNNLHTGLQGTASYDFHPSAADRPDVENAAVFAGYVRPDGRVGTRNEIWIIPTVGCVARTADRIARAAEAGLPAHIDGIHAFNHPLGCSQLGDDLLGTRRVLASLACHPNAGGVLIVGLGCEENQLDALVAELPQDRRSQIRTMVAQLATDELEEGIALVRELIVQAQTPRVQVPLSKLVLGVKCGGSDGLSGLTANPLVGRISDRVAEAGGSVLMTEIPEMFGAEQLLMDRAANRQVFDGIVSLVNGFKQYFLDHGEPVSENPSPGNVAGGITTLEEKSLGAVQKGGRATVTDVIRYGERVCTTGLTLLEAPGNDAVSCTALAAAGATAILFTTGRGTPLGFPVPTIKIASNTALAERKPGWIDFDAGQVLAAGMDQAADGLLDAVVASASGTPTRAERNGEREIAIWKRGLTL